MDETSVPGEVESLVETVEDAADGGGDVSVGELVAAIGDDALASLMLLPALVMVSPASGIPGLSTACAVIIALASVQLTLGRHTLWLPSMLSERSIARATLDKAAAWMERPARLIDRLTRPRLCFLASRPFSIVPALLCTLIALCVPVLEFVPFSATLAGAAIAFISLGLVARDGLLIVAGLAATMGAAMLVWTMTT